ncbi:MAG: pyrroline-5-carboxylate reductase [Lachnospiraceae bacterium]|nr:pyrroline-5-carboxylate reductase [Lachnospiraceae bacterium]
MRIGIIGLGNMGGAILGGIVSKGIVSKENIIGFDVNNNMKNKASEKYGIKTASDNKEVLANSDVVLLAVKPQFMGSMLADIKDSWNKDTLIISIAAGKTIAWLEENIGSDKKIVRCMPNTPALIGEGCTGVCANKNVSEEDKKTAINILSACGKAIEVTESQMDAVVGISGSAPAYVFMFIEAMADAGVAAGLTRDKAYEFAASAVKGSAALMLETGKHPGELKDMVCSPAGTTIAAVQVLEEGGFRGVVMDAVEACVERNREL